MDADRFDDALRALSQAPSRRGVVGALGSLALAGPLGALLDRGVVEAKKKKRKKKKKKCKGGTKKCGKRCIPSASCCVDCGDLGVCEAGGCVCLSGARPCQGTCVPVDDCCASAECGQYAVCASGNCACRSGYKECNGECITQGACCGDESDCGEDADGSCICETENGGGKICHKEDPAAVMDTCEKCPGGTHCVRVDIDVFRCYKLCGAS